MTDDEFIVEGNNAPKIAGDNSTEEILKSTSMRDAANLTDYDEIRRQFTWKWAEQHLDRLPGGGLNIAHEAVDRHVQHGLGECTALRWISRDEQRHDISYGALAKSSNQFANVLDSLGV